MNGLRVLVSIVAVLATIACSVVLFRGYIHQRVRVLKWSGIFFAFLTLSNVALFVDALVFPGLDLRLARLIPTVMGTACLLYGFIWDVE